MNTLAERLRYAMQVATPKKIKGVDLASAVDVKPPSVSDWLSGKSKTMEGENLLRAAKFLNVNPMWLATGTGEMRPSKTEAQKNLALSELMKKLESLNSDGELSEDTIKLLSSTLDLVSKVKEKQDVIEAGDHPAISRSA